jgi:hypothetical protein
MFNGRLTGSYTLASVDRLHNPNKPVSFAEDRFNIAGFRSILAERRSNLRDRSIDARLQIFDIHPRPKTSGNFFPRDQFAAPVHQQQEQFHRARRQLHPAI